MRLPGWTWRWAWNGFLDWSLNPALPETLTARQRWEVVYWTVGPGVRHHYLKPAEAWLHRHLPTPLLILRLEHHGSGWYRIPSISAALHVWRRLGIQLREDSFVRIENGVVTAEGFVDDELERCEFWYVDR